MAHTGSDWAADREDKLSMSGGMVVHNEGLVKFWSCRQKTVSLSSWETELFAAVTTGAEAIGRQRGLRDIEIAQDEACIRMVKIGTDLKRTDLPTKPLPFKRIQELCKLV